MAESDDRPVSVQVKRSPKWLSLLPSKTSTVLLIYVILSLLLNGDVTPLVRRGFFCDDSSINYPVKDNTVGLKMLIFAALIMPGLLIKCCDAYLIKLVKKLPDEGKSNFRYLNKRRQRRRRKISGDILEIDAEEEELIASVPDRVKRRQLVCNEDSSDYEPLDSDVIKTLPDGHEAGIIESDCEKDDATLFSSVPLDSEPEQSNNITQPSPLAKANLFQRIFGECQLFFFGTATTMLFTGIGKITCGRMRPHFMQKCKPSIDCSLKSNWGRYIEEYTCTNKDLRAFDLSYITTSWPSGHASIIFFSMVYLIIYLNTTIPILVKLSPDQVKKRFNPIALHALYVLLIAVAIYVSMTRIFDYHHHSTDVLSGSVIGTIIAIALSTLIYRQYLHALNLKNSK